MKTIRFIALLSLTAISSFYFLGCSSDKSKKQTEIAKDSTAKKTVDNSSSSQTVEGTTIYYDLPSPVEMAHLLRNTNATFYPELLNTTDNSKRYLTNSSQALNLGIYGVDLSYSKIFGQVQQSINYLKVIKDLSAKLNIPEDQTSKAFSQLSKKIEDKEELLSIISQTYSTTDKYLKSNGRANIAGLIILGGWIEGLYLATSIYEKDKNNKNILIRIAEQKYSLSTIVQLLAQNQNDEKVRELLPQLISLKKIYGSVKIQYDSKGVNIDSVRKVIIINDKAPKISATPEQIKAVREIVTGLREKIIE